MKLFLYLFSVITFMNGCHDENSKEQTTKNAQDAITIEYEASSRGYYQKVNLSKDQLAVVRQRGGTVLTKEMSSEDWTAIMEILDKIDVEKLEKNYVNPDDLRRDAVIPAMLTINYKENTVSNVEFGHGSAPEILQPLMTKIEAMINAVDKP